MWIKLGLKYCPPSAATHLEASDYTQMQLYYRALPKPMQQQVHAASLRARPPPSTLATTTSMWFLHVDQTRAKILPPNAATHLEASYYTQVQLSGGRGGGWAHLTSRALLKNEDAQPEQLVW